MLPQLVIELDEGLARALERAFGDGAFDEWAARMRASGQLLDAWGGDDPPPPVFFVPSPGLEERLMTDEERMAMERTGFDEEGVAKGGKYAVRVVPVETGPQVHLELGATLAAVPGAGGTQP